MAVNSPRPRVSGLFTAILFSATCNNYYLMLFQRAPEQESITYLIFGGFVRHYACKEPINNISADSAICDFRKPKGLRTHASVPLFYIVTGISKPSFKLIAQFFTSYSLRSDVLILLNTTKKERQLFVQVILTVLCPGY